MSDIVQQLSGRCGCSINSTPCMSENECRLDKAAVAEIKRLQAELELAEAEIAYRDRAEIFPAHAKEAEIKRLRVENARLRDELRKAEIWISDIAEASER